MPNVKFLINSAKLTGLTMLLQSALEIADIYDLEKADIALIVAARYLNKQQQTKKEALARLSKWMDNAVSDPLNIK